MGSQPLRRRRVRSLSTAPVLLAPRGPVTEPARADVLGASQLALVAFGAGVSVVRTLVAHRASESFGVLPKGTYATPAPLQSRHDSCSVNPAALTFRASGLTFHADAPVLQQLTQGGLQ